MAPTEDPNFTAFVGPPSSPPASVVSHRGNPHHVVGDGVDPRVICDVLQPFEGSVSHVILSCLPCARSFPLEDGASSRGGLGGGARAKQNCKSRTKEKRKRKRTDRVNTCVDTTARRWGGGTGGAMAPVGRWSNRTLLSVKLSRHSDAGKPTWWCRWGGGAVGVVAASAVVQWQWWGGGTVGVVAAVAQWQWWGCGSGGVVDGRGQGSGGFTANAHNDIPPWWKRHRNENGESDKEKGTPKESSHVKVTAACTFANTLRSRCLCVVTVPSRSVGHLSTGDPNVRSTSQIRLAAANMASKVPFADSSV